MPASKFVEFKVVEAKVGGRILLDGWREGRDLLEGIPAEKCEGGFAGSEFTISTGRDFGVRQLALNIEITGRTIQMIDRGMDRCPAVRIRVVIIGDGEENTTHSGWLYT